MPTEPGFRGVFRSVTRFIESQSAYLGVAWGIVVFLPFADLFESDPIYRHLLRLMPEMAWGMVVMILAAFQGWAAWRNDLYWRRKAAFYMCVIWAYIALNFSQATISAVSDGGWNTVNLKLMAALCYPLFFVENVASLITLSIRADRTSPNTD
jgi:hypothetical protein